MTINFSQSKPVAPPSLACRLELDGKIRWRDMTACRLTYDDNEAEDVPVYVTRKRELHVVTDAVLRARADMETAPQGRLSGLRLDLFPV